MLIGRKRGQSENVVRTGQQMFAYNHNSNNSRINSGLQDRQRCTSYTFLGNWASQKLCASG